MVENCWENRAWADTGAAWFCRASSGVLSHSVVQNCRLCANNGTKAVLQSSAGRVSNVLVRDCRVDSGLNYPIVRSSSLWDNCTVVDNSLEGGTMNGRVHLRVESALGGFRNCVFANNSANSKRELMVSLGSSTNLFNAADCDQPVGSGCIQIDEDRYRDFFLDQPAGNYRASARSPIKNGGDESAADLPQIDLDGRPRWVGKKPDVGCYESVTPDGLLLIFK